VGPMRSQLLTVSKLACRSGQALAVFKLVATVYIATPPLTVNETEDLQARASDPMRCEGPRTFCVPPVLAHAVVLA
jgi:hypothetical protein